LGCSEDKIDGSTDVYGSISGKVVSSDAFTLENVKVFSSPASNIVLLMQENTISNVSWRVCAPSSEGRLSNKV
jgi:hypothetical protein